MKYVLRIHNYRTGEIDSSRSFQDFRRAWKAYLEVIRDWRGEKLCVFTLPVSKDKVFAFNDETKTFWSAGLIEAN